MVSDEVREQLKLDEGAGALIEAIIPGSTAEAAGFKAGDVLLTLDGVKIAGATELVQKIAGRKAGALSRSSFAAATLSEKKPSRSRHVRSRRATSTRSCTARSPAAPAGCGRS